MSLLYKSFYFMKSKIKEVGKVQELIQTSTTPDSGHHMRKVEKKTRIHHTQEGEEASPFPTCNNKAAGNRRNEDNHETQ